MTSRLLTTLDEAGTETSWELIDTNWENIDENWEG